jgi:sugar/nucleoside kinase (ribokinase family)
VNACDEDQERRGMPSVTVIGCVQVDLVLTPVAELPPAGTSVFVDDMSLRVGGAGANASLALAELGIAPRLVGCVGDDHFGRWILGMLRRHGLAADVQMDPHGRTGLTVACEAPLRDRSFLTYLGVTATATSAIVPADALTADHLLLCDYFCAPGMRGESSRRLLAEARAGGATTYFDTSWDAGGWRPETREELFGLLPLVDVFLPNEAEACALAATASVPAAGRLLQEATGGWVVVKLGPRGCIAFGPDGARMTTPAPVVEATDTIGAGDAFNAGLVAALAAGRAWSDVLPAATAFASRMVARPSDGRYAEASPFGSAPSRLCESGRPGRPLRSGRGTARG